MIDKRFMSCSMKDNFSFGKVVLNSLCATSPKHRRVLWKAIWVKVYGDIFQTLLEEEYRIIKGSEKDRRAAFDNIMGLVRSTL